MFWHKKHTDEEKAEWSKYHHWHGKGGGMGMHFLAFLGALIYFEQQAHSFGEVLLAFFQALIWPAILVYMLLDSFKL